MVDLGLMTEAQTKDRHLYRQAMANYIAWLQPNWLERKCELRQQFTRLRAEITNELSDYKIHSRLPDVVAILLIALTTALEFAKSTGELKADEYDLF
ncbi:DNA primase, partial [Dehalococcoides mccartyi]